MGRFLQGDTIVPAPGNPQALNRYSYANDNPLRYTDPTGMFSEDEIMTYLGVDTWDEVLALFGEGGEYAGRWGWLEVLRTAQIGDKVAFTLGGLVDGEKPVETHSFEGVFAEDDHGQLGLQGSSDGTLYDPAIVLKSMQHDGYHLYGWYPADMDQLGMWMGGRAVPSRQTVSTLEVRGLESPHEPSGIVTRS